MRPRNSHTRLLQTGFEIFFGALLGMKTCRVVIGPLSRPQFALRAGVFLSHSCVMGSIVQHAARFQDLTDKPVARRNSLFDFLWRAHQQVHREIPWHSLASTARAIPNSCVNLNGLSTSTVFIFLPNGSAF